MSTKAPRLILTVVAALVMSVIGLAGGVAQAAAQPYCWNTGCTDKNPTGTSCEADAITKTAGSFSEGGFYYEMRYSPSCSAVWTRVTAPAGGNCNTRFAQIRTYSLSTRSQINADGVQANCYGTRRAWTNMMPFDGYWIRSCVAWSWYEATPNICGAYQ